MTQYKTGEEIEVQICGPDISTEKWVPAIFKSYISALDREYRLNVVLTKSLFGCDDIKLNGVAPECVRKKR